MSFMMNSESNMVYNLDSGVVASRKKEESTDTWNESWKIPIVWFRLHKCQEQASP